MTKPKPNPLRRTLAEIARPVECSIEYARDSGYAKNTYAFRVVTDAYISGYRQCVADLIKRIEEEKGTKS